MTGDVSICEKRKDQEHSEARVGSTARSPYLRQGRQPVESRSQISVSDLVSEPDLWARYGTLDLCGFLDL